jgi:hypothetical protein
MAAVSALLLGSSFDRLSPLPAGLAMSPEVVQQQVPFRRAKPVMALQQAGDGTQTIIKEPQPTQNNPTE